ncbi:MAG: nitrogenase molybdenum-iron protein alpha chain [Planctomycetota bacterium]|nr:MAG: nitrogenase molybdenum-iron protein alpha chain [Planctomycetota bacterium]
MNPPTNAPPSTRPDAESVRQAMIEAFPKKVARKRAKHIVVNDGSETPQQIEANNRTVPGIITQRGCTYAGCKGVILGPTRDVLSITHGPIGCGYYSWLTRRNQTRPPTDDDANYITYSLSTDMMEEQIVFGGEKKLKLAIQEAFDTFKPKSIAIHATCPVGLIGDDVHAVAREMKKELGINIFGFSCEGYKGVSQSAGHHIANNKIFQDVVSHEGYDNGHESLEKPTGPFRINLLGEYNIGGDAFVIEDLFERCGINMVASFSGNSTYDQMALSRHVELNAVMCHRSINYIGEMMEKAYGIPWIKVNFIGAEQTAKSLRRIAAFFGDEDLMARVEAVIAEEMPAVEAARLDAHSRCQGKTAMLFVGGSRAHHYQYLFHELGMETIAAGYEFGHRDDYEGRQALPSIKIDADSRNIEEITVERAEAEYVDRKDPAAGERVAAIGGEGYDDYHGLMPEMKEGTLTIDDISEHELNVLIEQWKPNIICCGIKEKYGIQKRGVPSKQLHSYDYGGPYAGFAGAIIFYAEIDRMVNSPIWGYIKAPWEKAA